MSDSVLNPKTNRFVRIGTQKYKRLIREGVLKEPPQSPKEFAPTPEPIEPPPSPIETQKFNEDDYHAKMAETFQKIVKENESKLVDLTQKQTDVLLKKLLYQKLCVDKPEKPKKVKKPKKAKKKKFKIVQPSSSESESESESE